MPTTTAPIAHRLAQQLCHVWRFQGPAIARIALRPTDRQLASRPFCGLTLWLDLARSEAHRLLYLTGERFMEDRGLIAGLVPRGGHVVDVGANVGYYALLFASLVGPKGRVTCIEPVPDNLRELERNRDANPAAPLTVIAAAAGAEPGAVRMERDLNGRIRDDGAGDIVVPVMTLDALSGPVSFVKIDVEGYEMFVLRGAQRLIRDQRPTLLVEMHPHTMPDGGGVRDVLGLLAPLYPAIRFYHLPVLGRWDRAVDRYVSGHGAVRAVDDPDALVRACDEGRVRESFWIVAGR